MSSYNDSPKSLSVLDEYMVKHIFDDDGVDVTPKPLEYDEEICSLSKSESESSDEVSDSFGISSMQFTSNISEKYSLELSDEKDYVEALSQAKKKITSKKLEEDKRYHQFAISILLRETPTVWLLDLSSITAIKETDDGQSETLSSHGTRYQEQSSVQTFTVVQKKKICQTTLIEQKENCVFATEWDLYDTYRRLAYETEFECEELRDYENENAEAEQETPEEKYPQTTIMIATTTEDNRKVENGTKKTKYQIKKLFQMPELKYAIVVAERLLASNNFCQEQSLFMGMDTFDGLEQSRFHYEMNKLWTFSCKETENRSVNAIAWNPVNQNVVAVGYGKYYYRDNFDGLLCCWSSKNPNQPEKLYHIQSSVTTVSFSKTQPNLLAVGCYSGAILVLNIATLNGDSMILNEKIAPHYGPVWKVLWFNYTDFMMEVEEIISVGNNGWVWKWNHKQEYRCYELMKLKYSLPLLKNVKSQQITVSHLTGLSISMHPKKHMIYYISTKEGCVIKCAINHEDRFEDIFPAHSGSVYGIAHSPFCSSIFLTYGADWLICLWAENMHEPLLKLFCTKEAVEDVAWSPTHSTVLASVSSNQLALWDLARKTIVPMSVIKASASIHFTTVMFSPSGKNILVGDSRGKVLVFNLTDMPYLPFLQEEALIRGLENALVSKPDVIKKLRSNLSHNN